MRRDRGRRPLNDAFAEQVYVFIPIANIAHGFQFSLSANGGQAISIASPKDKKRYSWASASA